MTSTRVTRANVARALDGHAAAGLIRGWRWHPDPPAGTTPAAMHLLIDPVDGETIRTRTRAEAEVACAMLASAAHAILRMPDPGRARPGIYTRATRSPSPTRSTARSLCTGHLVIPGAPWVGWHRVVPDAPGPGEPGFIDVGPAYKADPPPGRPHHQRLRRSQS